MTGWNPAISRLVLGAIAAITFTAYLTSFYGWKIYLELFSHFQVQYLLICLILLGILVASRRRRPAYAALLLCATLSLQILTWYLPPRRLSFDPNPEADLRVFIANINTKNRSYDRVLDLVRSEKPDLAIFMEVDGAWQARLEALGDLLPYSSGHSYPYNLGLIVRSNQPLNDLRVEFFGTDKNASAIARLTVANQPVTLLATHPLPPVKPSFFQSRNRQLGLIAEDLAGVNNRIILAGDLNTTMWSPYYRRLVGKTGLRNTRKGFGILPTWPTSGTYRWLPGWLTSLFVIPIDHCLVSPGLDTIDIYTGGDTGSDHKPLIVDLRIAGE